jgi:hypothetical protein
MRHRVAFIGGPICGKQMRVQTDDLTQYVGVLVGSREYLYKFELKSGAKGKRPITIKRRYRFQGHAAKLPEVH